MWEVCIYTQSKCGIREEGEVWGKGRGEVNQEKITTATITTTTTKTITWAAPGHSLHPRLFPLNIIWAQKSPTVSRKARESPYVRKVFTEAIPLIHGSVFSSDEYRSMIHHFFFLPLYRICFSLRLIHPCLKRDLEAWSWLIDLWLFDYLVFTIFFLCSYISWWFLFS